MVLATLIVSTVTLGMRVAPPPRVQLEQAWLAGWMVCQPAAPVDVVPTSGFSGGVVPTKFPPPKATPTTDPVDEVDIILLGAKRAAADQVAFAEEMWEKSRMRLMDEVWALVNPIYRRDPTVQRAINRHFSSGGVVPTKTSRPPAAAAEAPLPAEVTTTASPAGALPGTSWPAPTRQDEFRMMFPQAARRPPNIARTPNRRPSRGRVDGPQMSSAQSYDWRERQRALLKAELEALYREPVQAPASGRATGASAAAATTAPAPVPPPHHASAAAAQPPDDEPYEWSAQSHEWRRQGRKLAWRLRRRWQRQQLVWAWLYLQGWVDGTSVGGRLTNSSAGLALAEKLARSDALTAPLRRPGLATQLALAGATAGVVTQLAPLAGPASNIAVGGATAFCAGALGAGAALGGAVTRTAAVVARRAGAGALTAVGVVTGAEACARALVAAIAACVAATVTWVVRVVEWMPLALEAAVKGIAGLPAELATRGAAVGATTAAGGAATVASASQFAASCAAVAMAWGTVALTTVVAMWSRAATALLAAAAVAASAAKVAAAAAAHAAASAATAVAGGAAPVGAMASQLGASLLAAAGAVGAQGGATAATAASATVATAAMATSAARAFLVSAASVTASVASVGTAAVGGAGGAATTRLWAAVAAAPMDALLLTAMVAGALRMATAGGGGVRATATALLGRANAARLGAADALSGAGGALSSAGDVALGRTRAALSAIGGAVARVTSGAKAGVKAGDATTTKAKDGAAVLTARQRKFVVPSLLVAAAVVVSTQLAIGALLASALRLLEGVAGGLPGALRIPLRVMVGSG